MAGSSLEERLSTFDITQLAYYLKKVEETPRVSKLMAGVHLAELVKGQDVAYALLSQAVHMDVKAKQELDRCEAVAYLDRASEYLSARGIRDSSEARKRYVDLDPDVLGAKERKAKTEALVTLLKGKVAILRQSHDDLKKTVYGDNNLTPYEGI